jgi:hypothetical protein
MVRLARINLAAPGKQFELIAALKESAALVKEIIGVEVTTFTSMGSKVGETVSVLNFKSFAEWEELSAKLLSNPKWQAFSKKFDGLVVPGYSHDHFLRQV